jgi:tRNA 5-methylaminomethyl-2-thiouridine biosynthesis bifunctional protein
MAQMRRRAMSRQQFKKITIIGAGLAGAACASVFAHAGYSVTAYEQAAMPASGASGVPIALFAPSVSADDAPHSRLLRSGVNLLLQELRRLTDAGLLVEGADWAMSGVLERCIRGDKKLPAAWLEPQDPLNLRSRVASRQPLELFHGAAGWVNPKRLVGAWLAHPHIELQINSRIHDVQQLDADVVVVACGHQSAELLPALKATLQPIRGQLEWGDAQPDFDQLSPSGCGYPINGMGHFIQTPHTWVAGATFQRDESDLTPRGKDVDLNFEKLEILLPELRSLRLARLRTQSSSWVGVRTAQKNRQPLIEKIENTQHPPIWVCAGLGSRGLSLAALCASRLLASVESGLAFS